jgi:hypothetical protein|tara:strand:- start:267 stop:563 length:297 start_codon:yes stop_codon:yes gene_type:complete
MQAICNVPLYSFGKFGISRKGQQGNPTHIVAMGRLPNRKPHRVVGLVQLCTRASGANNNREKKESKADQRTMFPKNGKEKNREFGVRKYASSLSSPVR